VKKSIAMVFVFLICATARAQMDETITISSGSRWRSFIAHLPAAQPPANLPVLICYHGAGGNAVEMAQTGFGDLADVNGFIVAYPWSEPVSGVLMWNSWIDNKPGFPGDSKAADDVRFTLDLIDELARRYNIDRSRVYASGFSSGGFMCYALSMLASDKIAGIAPVAATMLADANYLKTLLDSGTVRPIPVMHIHGTVDSTVMYPDPDNTPADSGEYPLYLAARACNAATYHSVEPVMAGVDKLVFCGPPTEVILVRITGMGHAWFNGSYETATEIVRFFGLMKQTGIETGAPVAASVLLTPNPVRDVLRISAPSGASVQMIDALGRLVFETADAFSVTPIETGSMAPGLYLVRVMLKGAAPPVQRRVLVVR
jgi:endoglucanase